MTRRKNLETAENEARLQQAITEYQKQKKSQKVSLRRIAKEFNVPRQTLKDRLDGKLPRNKAQEQLMHLTNEEENELVHWITTLTQCGYAPRSLTQINAVPGSS
jgi:helix-turn-helix, Psq domain